MLIVSRAYFVYFIVIQRFDVLQLDKNSAVSCGQSLRHLLFPDDCSHPVESVSLQIQIGGLVFPPNTHLTTNNVGKCLRRRSSWPRSSSTLLPSNPIPSRMQISVRAKKATLSDPMPSSFTPSMIVNVLNRAASLPANWISDNDLYNTQRRACKLVAMTGPNRFAPPIDDSPSADAASIQHDDKLSAPLAEPPVKRESLEPGTLPLPPCQGTTGTKRRLEENDADVGDQGQPSKRGRFSPDHDA